MYPKALRCDSWNRWNLFLMWSVYELLNALIELHMHEGWNFYLNGAIIGFSMKTLFRGISYLQ
jgi:hypothetical protein